MRRSTPERDHHQNCRSSPERCDHHHNVEITTRIGHRYQQLDFPRRNVIPTGQSSGYTLHAHQTHTCACISAFTGQPSSNKPVGNEEASPSIIARNIELIPAPSFSRHTNWSQTTFAFSIGDHYNLSFISY